MLTSASLYVSSLSSSGIRALMTVMPSILVAVLTMQWIGMWITIGFVDLYTYRPAWRPVLGWLFGGSENQIAILTAVALALSALLLRFAHANHRSAERPRTQLRRQIGWIAGAIAAGWTVLFVSGVR